MNWLLLRNIVSRLSFYITIGLLLGLGLVACRTTTLDAPTDQPPESTATLASPPTDTPLPSPTTPPGLVVLVAPPEADTALVLDLQSVLAELASQDGLRFETREQFSVSDITTDVRLVIATVPDRGVSEWAAAKPEVKFLAVDVPGLQAAPNMSVIGAQGPRPDQQGFLAGYLAAVITQDWRVGVISQADSTTGKAARQSFLNGAVFYCGLCRPAYPPFFQYPIYVEVPSGAASETLQAAVDTMVANAVQTVYVAPGVEDPILFEALAGADVNIIASSPPAPQAAAQWVATLDVDLVGAVRQVWPALMGGEPGESVDLPLVMLDRNPEKFSPGRQRLVDKMLADLLAGYIDTGVDPTTGEPR